MRLIYVVDETIYYAVYSTTHKWNALVNADSGEFVLASNGFGQTITLHKDIEVDDASATWFMANATMAETLPEDKTNILYDGKCIASLEAG